MTYSSHDLFTNLEYIGFTAPAIGCLEGSAWHTWASHGAYYASRNDGDIGGAATRFAAGPDHNYGEHSAIYHTRRRAFIAGANGRGPF